MYVCVTMNVMCKLSINHHCKNLLLEPYSAPNQQDKKEAEDKKKKKKSNSAGAEQREQTLNKFTRTAGEDE